MDLQKEMIQQHSEIALDILNKHLEDTGWNFYSKIKLKRQTGISDKELFCMLKDGIISRRQGINDTLIILNKC